MHTGIQALTLHEMCRETLNNHIGTGTSHLNVQVVLYRAFYTFILLPCCFGEPPDDVTL